MAPGQVSDPISDLLLVVEAARRGEQEAWNQLVERYLPLVSAVVRRHRLADADGDDVKQTVWLRLVEHLDDVRETAALPGWIATVTRNECLRVLATRNRFRLIDPLESEQWGEATELDLDKQMVDLVERQALREALAKLPDDRRRLLLMMLEDPPVSYAEISERLGIPIGSIGPTRARALAQLRSTPTIRALGRDEESMKGGDTR